MFFRYEHGLINTNNITKIELKGSGTFAYGKLKEEVWISFTDGKKEQFLFEKKHFDEFMSCLNEFSWQAEKGKFI